MTHRPTLPLTGHEREFAACLLASGWSVSRVARALQAKRSLTS